MSARGGGARIGALPSEKSRKFYFRYIWGHFCFIFFCIYTIELMLTICYLMQVNLIIYLLIVKTILFRHIYVYVNPVFKSLVLSRLDYGSQLWSPYKA